MNYIFDTFIGILKTFGDCIIIYLRDLGGALFDLKNVIGIIISGLILIPRLYKLFDRM